MKSIGPFLFLALVFALPQAIPSESRNLFLRGRVPASAFVEIDQETKEIVMKSNAGDKAYTVQRRLEANQLTVDIIIH